jgi:hypothetical protein
MVVLATQGNAHITPKMLVLQAWRGESPAALRLGVKCIKSFNIIIIIIIIIINIIIIKLPN